MTAIFVVAAIAVVGAVIARVTWRRPADERHSIQSHQQTLDTLRSMADRRPGTARDGVPRDSSVPAEAARPPKSRGDAGAKSPVSGGPVASVPTRATATRSGAAAGGTVRSGPVRASSSGGAGREELVFVDEAGGSSEARHEGSPRISPLTSAKGLHRADRIDRLTRRRHGGAVGRVVPVVAAVAVLGLVVGVAVALAPSHHVTPQAHGTTPLTRATGHVRHHQTNVTAPSHVQPTTSTANTATYGVPSTSYTVTLLATGPCWVDATNPSTGAVVWTGTLQTGQSQAIAGKGSMTVRLGAANNVTVSLNRVPVVLPTGLQSPSDLRFAAA